MCCPPHFRSRESEREQAAKGRRTARQEGQGVSAKCQQRLRFPLGSSHSLTPQKLGELFGTTARVVGWLSLPTTTAGTAIAVLAWLLTLLLLTDEKRLHVSPGALATQHKLCRGEGVDGSSLSLERFFCNANVILQNED